MIAFPVISNKFTLNGRGGKKETQLLPVHFDEAGLKSIRKEMVASLYTAFKMKVFRMSDQLNPSVLVGFSITRVWSGRCSVGHPGMPADSHRIDGMVQSDG